MPWTREKKYFASLLIWRQNHSKYEVHTISFQTFFVWAFRIVVDSWKFTMLLLYILWNDWPIFMISGSNEQLHQSGREDTLEERYAIKFCFKLGKNVKKRMECFRLLFEHLAWIEHQFLGGIRDSMKAGSLWGMMIVVGGVINQG